MAKEEVGVASVQTTEVVLGPLGGNPQTEKLDCKQSPSSSDSPGTILNDQKDPDALQVPSVGTTPQTTYQLPEHVSQILHKGFHGDPLPASLSEPPTSQTPLLGNKIQWHGGWREGWEPRWGDTEARIEDIRQVVMPFTRFCGLDPKFTVDPFLQGMWNKLYLIASKNEQTGVLTERIFRVPLPVNPWFKTQSEVATMEYVRKKTTITVPKVYVFDSSMDNDVGFEWMIMEKIDGRAFRDVKESMCLPKKESLNRTIAEWVDQLSKLQFDRIGSLYRQWDPTKPDYLDFKLGPVTSDHFLGPWRNEKEIFRGPFHNDAQLYRSIIELNLADILDPRHLDLAKRAWAEVEYPDYVAVPGPDEEEMTQTPTTVYSTNDAFEASGVKHACFSILGLLPIIENQLTQHQRNYVLYHFDISQTNVLVNDAGAAVALLDWENISTQSLSQISPWPSIIDATRYPRPELSKSSGPRSSWHVTAEKNYETRLAADAFMQRLKELRSPWPQIEGIEQNSTNDFEEDLAELGSLVKEIYAGWAEVKLCDEMKEKYGTMFQLIPTQKPVRKQDAKFSVPGPSSSGSKETEYTHLFENLPRKRRFRPSILRLQY